jgi:hypothetical protein
MKPVQSLLSSADGNYRAQLNETKGLVNKWEKTGLLEGMSAEYDKHGMAIMLENQAKQLVQEANATGTANNSEQWAGVALPLVRRIFAEIAAKDFVSVQPMNLPSGLVFYLDFKYGTSVAGFNTSNGGATDPTKPAYQNNSVFGVTNDTVDPSQGLYGAGRFGYSINDQTSVVGITGSLAGGPIAASGSVTISTFATAGTLEQVNYDTKFSASFAPTSASIKVITVSTASFTNPDLKGIRAFIPSGSGISAVFPQFTTYNATNETISFVVSGSISTTATATNVTFTYQVQPTPASRDDFEDRTGGSSNINIPEINVELKSDPITAKTRKLKAIWTPEFAQDLNAYHSIDAEAELTSMLSEYISMEIDLEILDMLIQNAVTTEYWSTQVGEYWNGNGFTSDSATNAASAYNQGQWFQTLGTKIQKVSNKIHQKTLRGGANFLVCSPDVATILESIPGYAADTNGDKMQFAMGVQKVGMLNSRFTVYKNPYMLENTILLGYRGAQFLETGAVYAPYVPLIMTPLVYDPTNFTPRKGVMTRYAKKVVRPEFYGKIYVKGLQSV